MKAVAILKGVAVMFKLKALILALVCAIILVSAGGCFSFTSPPPGLDTVNATWTIIFQNYVERDKLDANALSQGAIRGIMQTLNDPHSAYLTSEIYQIQMKNLRGTYQGIGVHVSMKDGYVIFVAPFEDSPAQKAGIKPGDRLLKINNESIEGLSLTETALKIQGPAGTDVTVTILHEGETEAVNLTITRAEIKLKSTFWNMLEDIAYIRLASFSTLTPSEFHDALQDTLPGAKGVILDLRNNTGGPFQSAIDVASYFIKEGTVTYSLNNRGEKTTLGVTKTEFTTDLPLVVLVNGFSASASEVLAGALQDLGRAKLAGTRTLGKGSLNQVFPLNDGSAIYLTTGRWLTPSGNLIEGVGLSPDFPLELEGEELVDWAIDYLKTQQGTRTAKEVTAPTVTAGVPLSLAENIAWYPVEEVAPHPQRMPA